MVGYRDGKKDTVLNLKIAHGEKSSADNESAKQWKITKIPNFLENFCDDDIYNADETRLYFVLRQTTMDRITLFCCTNMSDTDKRKLLMIGKSARPRCFKGLRMVGLPVECHTNKNANILLLVDNCAAHPHSDNLQNIQPEFLPPYTTSLVQPMDMGIIKNFKTLYRGKLVNYILESIDENLLTSSTTAREISSNVSLLQAIQFVADSWRAIKTTTIQNCFTICSFKPLDISEILSNKENEDIWQDLIVEGIKSKHEKFEDDDDDESPVSVTDQEAKKCMAVLQRYFMQE
ncbi:hypothetical protein RF11_06316 [Thelohanellus kitauei]|uniref:DDE-1 domain-containing protein n=1 Tax=Thelohanellus kitauei TaxID=669202 RepID=A0A0C2IRT3_THEKT|nr:hypothetical protein RF11_06316 [Thelohanellus kitauei]